MSSRARSASRDPSSSPDGPETRSRSRAGASASPRRSRRRAPASNPSPTEQPVAPRPAKCAKRPAEGQPPPAVASARPPPAPERAREAIPQQPSDPSYYGGLGRTPPAGWTRPPVGGASFQAPPPEPMPPPPPPAPAAPAPAPAPPKDKVRRKTCPRCSAAVPTRSKACPCGHQFVFKSKKKPGARAPARAAPPVDTEAEARLKDQVARLEREACEAGDAREEREKLSQRRAALLQCVFRMRGEGILDAEAWARFLAPDFELWQPVCHHQSFRPSDVAGSVRVSRGVDGMIADVASLSVFLRSVGRRAPHSHRVTTSPVYECYVESPRAPGARQGDGPPGLELTEADAQVHFATDSSCGFWAMRTVDAVMHGARAECAARGMFRAAYSAGDQRLRNLELYYDVNGFLAAVERALGAPPPRVPVTPRDLRIMGSGEARVVTAPTAPHTIVDCNQPWLDLCGFPAKRDVVGRTLDLIQGPLTDRAVTKEVAAAVAREHATDATLINYKRDGAAFFNYLRVYPLYDGPSGRPTHYLGVLADHRTMRADADAALDELLLPELLP